MRGNFSPCCWPHLESKRERKTVTVGVGKKGGKMMFWNRKFFSYVRHFPLESWRNFGKHDEELLRPGRPECWPRFCLLPGLTRGRQQSGMHWKAIDEHSTSAICCFWKAWNDWMDLKLVHFFLHTLTRVNCLESELENVLLSTFSPLSFLNLLGLFAKRCICEKEELLKTTGK